LIETFLRQAVIFSLLVDTVLCCISLTVVGLLKATLRMWDNV